MPSESPAGTVTAAVDPVDWDLAQRVAERLAGREPLAESYLADSLEADFAEFTPVAERLVASETGLVSRLGPARARVISREEWIAANIASFQRLLRPLIAKLADKMGTGPLSGLTRRFAALELGAVLGWMSRRVLGQYDLLVIEEESPHDQDLVYFVGPNVLGVEKRFAFPPREFRLWLALHELTHRAQFTGVPWLRPYFLDQVESLVAEVEPDSERLLAALRRVRAARRDGTSTEGGMAMLLATDEQRATLDRLSGLMSLLEGHGDVTMSRAGADLVPSAARFGRVLQARRSQQTGVNKIVQRLLGFEAKLAQYEQGERFIAAVEAERGSRGIEPVWAAAHNLPTLAEIRQPDLWLRRVAPVAM
jgi:coenzyme F420 biosynthesis associated uncharacterized protein